MQATGSFQTTELARRLLRRGRRAVFQHSATPGFSFATLYARLATYDIAFVLDALRTCENGLSLTQVAARRKRDGRNVGSPTRRFVLLRRVVASFTNPSVLLLLGVSAVSFFLQDTAGGASIAVIALFSVAVSALQEGRSSAAAARLRERVTTLATVLRRPNSEPVEIPLQDLVEGDVIYLAAGDMVPADARVTAASDLHVTQAPLTGESFPVQKNAASSLCPLDALTDVACLLFMGSSVVGGTGTAVVIKTGPRTYLGSLDNMKGPRTRDGGRTNFHASVRQLTRALFIMIGITAPCVFLLTGVRHGALHGAWRSALQFAAAVAVGLTPQMLHVIMTTNLAKGAMALARRRVIVKRLHAVQNLGAMDVLCLDKTGTLTEDRVDVVQYLDVSGRNSNKVAQLAYVNSYFQRGIGNILDRTIIAHGQARADWLPLHAYRRRDEIPFDPARRRASVIVQEDGERSLLVCKGAVDELLAISASVIEHGEVVPLIGRNARHSLVKVAEGLHADGYRVLAIGYKELARQSLAHLTPLDEHGLTLVGFVAFYDPPKESARGALARLDELGTRVKILTGDHAIVTRKMCHDVGLRIDATQELEGAEVDAMSDAELVRVAPGVRVFAKLSPLQKRRVVEALRAAGSVVGYLGDGINDAPAMSVADVSISVDSAVDVAREHADLILLHKDLGVLADGVIEGRRVVANTEKYVRMGTAANFGNVVSVVGAAFFLPFVPMLPAQLLLQNLLYDVSQVAIPFDRVDAEDLMVPRRLRVGSIMSFMACLGPVSSVFDYAVFAVLGWAQAPSMALFRTGWFVWGLISQTLVVHVLRTRGNLLHAHAAKPLIVSTVGVALVGAVLPFTHWGRLAGLAPLTARYYGALVVLLAAYLVASQWVKKRYFAVIKQRAMRRGQLAEIPAYLH